MALPNGPLEIVFSFDTTGSMSGCIDEVRGRVSDMVQRLQADIPGIRFAIFAHGDYCDRAIYVTKFVDFTDDVGKLCDFVKNVEMTGGGDSDECYELVLHEVGTKLSWIPGSQRALVMIGDANPHGPSYPQNTLKLDWKREVEKIRDMGVRIYGVRCGGYGCENFFEHISKQTGGRHLALSDFKQVFDFLMSVCYNEKGAEMLDLYEKEVRARCGPVHKDLDRLFGDLRDSGPAGSDASDAASSSAPIPKHALLKKISSLPPKPSLKPSSSLTGVVKKSLKKRVATKRMRTVKDSLAKYKLENLPKHRREEVSENNFLLSEMKWSDWLLVISPNAKGSCCQKRQRGKAGYRTAQIFTGSTDKPALYEVAVQPKFRCRKCVVYSRCSRKGFTSGLNWERKLLGRKAIAAQIDSVVNKGCDVYVRRALLRSGQQRDSVKQSLKMYDYAWSVVRSERSSHRPVTKASVDISEDMEL